MSAARSLYFLAGEASGDTHGAALMTALHSLDQSLHFTGRGGPRMRAFAGGDFADWSEHSAVLGLWEVLKQYGYFRRQFQATLHEIARVKPAAVILIDYPGFNLRLARALRQQSLGGKIIYYISPQVWAWNRRRIPQMARALDLMLCIFPFEAALYNQSGLRTVFVGHPLMETLRAQETAVARQPDLIGLFPGSRMREVRKILPTMLQTAQRLAESKPELQFEIAAATAKLEREIQALLAVSALPAKRVRVTTGAATSLMQRAQAGIVASGTATLEAAFFRMPFLLVYRVAWPTYIAGRMLVRVPHLGMPNVLAGREIVPEFIQGAARPNEICAAVLRLLNDPIARETMLANFDNVIAGLGRGGASENAARAILEEIKQ